MKIVNKRRFITSITIMALLIVGIFSMSFAKGDKPTREYVVSAGETLWSIACENTTGDIRAYIYEIRQLNNLDGCMIYPGQVLKIK